MSFDHMSDEQASQALQEFIRETGKTEFTATDLLAWQQRREKFGLRVVEREERVSSIITINAEGQACMDSRFWMDYARRANVYRNTLLDIIREIEAMSSDEDRSELTIEILSMARKGLK